MTRREMLAQIRKVKGWEKASLEEWRGGIQVCSEAEYPQILTLVRIEPESQAAYRAILVAVKEMDMSPHDKPVICKTCGQKLSWYEASGRCDPCETRYVELKRERQLSKELRGEINA